MWLYRAHTGNPIRSQVPALLRQHISCQSSFFVITVTVARFGFTTFTLRSDPIRVSQMASNGGISSSNRTVKRGLSHLFMPFGSSYLNTKFSKRSWAYPPFGLPFSNCCALISLHFSAGVPTWTSRLVSLDLCSHDLLNIRSPHSLATLQLLPRSIIDSGSL